MKCKSPSPYTPPQYRIKMQLAPVDDSDPMTDKQINLLQQVCGTFLYYVQAVDCTMLHAFNNLATRTKNGTQETAKVLTHI